MESGSFSVSSLVNSATNIPLFSRILAVVMLGLYLIGLFFPASISIFSLTVGFTLAPKYYIFNLITAGLLDLSFISLIINLLVLLLASKEFDALWGSIEVVRFVMIVNFLTGIAIFLITILLFAFTTNEDWLYSTHWCGSSGMLAMFTVAMKQMFPEREIRVFGALPLRAKYFPSIVALIAILLLISGMDLTATPFAIFGVYFSWLYLRFWQKQGDVSGDASESFSFASFFPGLLRPFVTTATAPLSQVFRICGCYHGKQQPNRASTPAYLETPVSLADPADAERRRQRALQALDKRMEQLKTLTSSKVPEGEGTHGEANAEQEVVEAKV